MSRADLEKWERRYRAPGLTVGEPEPFIVEVVSGLEPTQGAGGRAVDLAGGRAVDLAGGLGRHAFVLAQRGFATTLVDVSPSGLRAAEASAQQRGLSVSTEAHDIEAGGIPPGPWAVVVVAWFLLDDRTWADLPRCLAPGGHLVYVQPTRTNLERHPRPSARFLLAPGGLEGRGRDAGLEILRAEEGWDDRGHHTARLWARAPSD